MLSSNVYQEVQRILQHTVHAINTLSIDSNFLDVLTHLLNIHGNIFFTGIGKSGIIAQKLAATYASLGFQACFIHPIEAMHGDMGRIQKNDTVFALSNSGKTQELLSFLRKLKDRNITIIALTNSYTNPLALLSTYVLCTGVVEEACPWNAIPTTSLHIAMLLGDALLLAYIHEKQLSSSAFFFNHPEGTLGTLLQCTAKDIMHTDLPKVYANISLFDALQNLTHYSYGIIFIVDSQNTLLGVITDGDLRRLLLTHADALKQPVSSLMNPSPITVPITASSAELLDIMEQHAITTLPVIDENNILCGIVHIHDVLGRGTVQFT